MATPIPKNAARFSLAEIASATSGKLVGARGEQSVTGVVTDSRAVEAGNLYVALRGEHQDGHAFVPQAFARGASVALVHDTAALPKGSAAVVVPDTLKALGDLAAMHRKRWNGRVVAITGSVGKTTTKELTFAALRAAGVKAARSAGNLNNLIGVPMSLFCLDAQSELCVLELGTSAPGEIARLADICAPDVGLVTQVAAAHSAGLGSLEQIAQEKASLLWALREDGIAIHRAEDAALGAQLGRVRARTRLSFGSSEEASVRLVRHRLDAAPSMVAELYLLEAHRALRCELRLFGEGPALDAAAAMAVVFALLGEGALDRAALGLLQVEPPPGRLRPLLGPLGSVILDDTYNANPASMRASIDTALALARSREGRTLLVLGDMLELGQASRSEHEAVGKQAAQPGVAAFIACGVEMTAAAEGAREQGRRLAHELSIAHLSDPAGAAQLVRPLLRERDVVLVKGSRSMAMERVVEGLVADEGSVP
jgi:UDP-N-acetylmuramoyl-tripeptide--D-alanyl-D-alanine ligase